MQPLHIHTYTYKSCVVATTVCACAWVRGRDLMGTEVYVFLIYAAIYKYILMLVVYIYHCVGTGCNAYMYIYVHVYT